MRGLAVALWCGFLGATLTLAVLLGFAHDLLASDLRGLSEAFIAAWILAAIPSALAYFLAASHGH